MKIEEYIHPNLLMDIICPKCGCKAYFQLSSAVRMKKTPPKYRDNVWQAADQNWGRSQCDHCVSRFDHLLDWPHDAYWKTEVRDSVLWAHSKDEIEMLIKFIKSKDRDQSKFPAYRYFLRHFPKEFLSAKNRDEVVKKLAGLLEKGT